MLMLLLLLLLLRVEVLGRIAPRTGWITAAAPPPAPPASTRPRPPTVHRHDALYSPDALLLLDSYFDCDCVAANEVQSIVCSDTGGSFKLSFRGNVTAAVSHAASLADLALALELLNTYDTFRCIDTTCNVTCCCCTVLL